MAIYQKNPIAVIDDSIYEDLMFYKSLLGNKEFATGLDKIKFIPLSDLSAAIPADRIDDFGVYFYLFERINSNDDYNRCYSLIRRSVNIENVLLFCQNRNIAFDFQAESNHKVYHYGIICDPYENSELSTASADRQHTERCIKLLAVLTTLCAVEERAFSCNQIAVKVKLNYEALYCAVTHKLFGYDDELIKREKQISEYKEKIEVLENKKPFLYKCNGFSDLSDEDFSDIPVSAKDPEQSLRVLSAAFSECDDTLSKNIDRDIEVVRYAMEETDSTATDDLTPKCLSKEEPSATSPIPTSNDLLKRIPSDPNSNVNLNISEALLTARSFTNFDKPKAKHFFLACISALGIFLLTIGSVYLVNILKYGLSSVNTDTLVLVLLIPVALIVVSAIVGYIINKADYGKIKKMLREITDAIRTLRDNTKSIILQVRDYLNTFITVFFNCHTRDYCIAQFKKTILQLENEMKQLWSGRSVYKTLRDMLRGAQEESLKSEAESNDSSYSGLSDDSDSLYGYSFDSEESIVVPHTASSRDGGKPCASISDKFGDAKECVRFITECRSTETVGNECEPFSHIVNPWISQIVFDVSKRGGDV